MGHESFTGHLPESCFFLLRLSCFGNLTVLTFFLFSFIAVPAQAAPRTDRANVSGPLAMTQSLDEEMLYLQEEKVVTPLQREQPISEAPSNTYVITAEDIRHSGATDIPTILRRIPGMEVMQTTGTDINVSVRGNNQLIANKLLVLIDGRSIFIDSQGGMFWKLLPISLADIQRIEVIKGPISAVYGFNAFDGVVNILTKSPRENQGTTLQLAGGEFGTVETSAIHSGRTNQISYRLSAGHSQNQAWRDRDSTSFQSSRFNFNGDYQFSSSNRLTFAASLVKAFRFDAPMSGVSHQPDTPLATHVSLGWDTPASLFRIFWNRFNSDSQSITLPNLTSILQSSDPNGNPTNHHATNTYDVLGQHSLPLRSFGHLTGGINFRHITTDSNFFSGFTAENRLGLYIQHQWNPIDPVQILSLVRYDLDTFINPTVSPMMAITYHLIPNHTMRFGVSIGYRPPAIAFSRLNSRTRLTIPGSGTLTTTNLGSPNLQPEKIISYELEYQGWMFSHRLRTRSALFFNQISDLIDFVSSGVAITDPVIASNGGNAEIYGGEVGIEFLLTRGLSGFGNVSYLDIEQTITSSLRRTAAHTKVNAGLRGQWSNGWSAEVLVHYVEPTTHTLSTAFAAFGVITPSPRVPSYTLVNLRGAYQFWHNQAEVAISVFNALNDRHREYPTGDVIGSRVMGWLTVMLPAGTFDSWF